MTLRDLVRSHLPPRAQDAARTALDVLSPSRRVTPVSDALARAVSPDGTVLTGPFRGLRLSVDGTWGGNAARLAGTYEKELHALVEHTVADHPELVVDLGAAEGYYAVGLARRLPAARVIAFELEPASRRLCRANARRNGVTNLTTRGRATPAALEAVLRPGAFVLCDVEGFEDVLMDPVASPTLGTCTLLIELHEFAVPGVTERLLDRWAGSHEATIIDHDTRTVADTAHLGHLAPNEALAAIDEGRPVDPPMQWVHLVPRPW